MQFVPDAHMQRKRTERLPGRSIGLSPPRLLFGRAANYGSIIVSCAGRRRSRWQSGFRCMGLIARPDGVLAHLQTWLSGHRKRIRWLVFICQATQEESPPTNQLLTFFAKWGIYVRNIFLAAKEPLPLFNC